MDDVRERLSKLSLEERRLLECQLLVRPGLKRTDSTERDQPSQLLSFAQESLWFLEQLVPGSPLYNMPQAFRLRGEVDSSALERAFQAVVQRQDALRTRFIALDGSAVQVPQEKPFRLQQDDLSAVPTPAREAQALALAEQDVRRSFSLSEDLLLRARLIRLAEREHILVVVAHHIVADFASLQILHQELSDNYHQLLHHGKCEQPCLPLPFTELAARQRQLAESPALEADYEYWREVLGSNLPVLQLPVDHPRGAVRTFSGARQEVTFSQELSDRLKELSRDEGVTLYSVLLAAFQTLLYRYSGQEQIMVGSPVEQRNEPGSEETIGLLLNTLVFRGDLSGNPTFRQLLERTRQVVAGALAHQHAPFEKLVERFKLSREPGSNPFYQVVFQYLPCDWPKPELEGVFAERLQVETGTAKFDLTFTILENTAGLIGELEYNTALFEPPTIRRMLRHFQVLLESIAADPDQRLSQLHILTRAERHQLLIEWNSTSTEYPRDRCVHQLVEEQAQCAPDAVALATETGTLTYAELNRQANQLARYLQRLGILPGQPVGLCLERSPELIVAILGILKAGGAYVPLDAKYPADRLSFMVRDSGVPLVITGERAVPPVLAPHQTLSLETCRDRIAQEPGDNPSSAASSDSLAYILYTSGSTGQPKGVAIPHRGIVRLVKNTNYASFSSAEVFLQFAPISFDASTFEIWGALLNGARLALYPPSFESLEQFAQVLEQHRVTTLWLTAGLFQQVVDQHLESLRGVRQLLAGGDVLSVPHIRKVLEHLPGCQLINGYGPTENTTFSCCYRFPSDWKGSSAPIGRPISNTRAYILDRDSMPVPIGVAGELCLAGDGLAREYWRSPELTARKFVPDPFSPDSKGRLYRTGDQARYRADGTIEFLGRIDDQVKVNGFRVHLGEVEATLQALPGIGNAAVVAQSTPSGTRTLVAYVAPATEAELTSKAVRDLLSQKLPAFMVPAHITVMPALPLNANGKVDRRALAPAAGADSSSRPVAMAESLAQEKILQIWRDVFGKQEIGIDDNFFDLGGHSLIATRVVARINQAFQCNLSLAALFRTPTARALADKAQEQEGTADCKPITRRKGGAS